MDRTAIVSNVVKLYILRNVRGRVCVLSLGGDGVYVTPTSSVWSSLVKTSTTNVLACLL